jgi:hypothetical protein
MFDSIKNQAAKSKSRSSTRKGVEIPRTVAFVSALKENGLRISYAALADASAELGEHTPSGLSAGQRGSSLLPGLPVTLQPNVCRANGSYAKGQEWPEAPDADIKALRKLDYVRPERILSFVSAFIKATAEPEVETAEPETPEAPEESADDVDTPDEG